MTRLKRTLLVLTLMFAFAAPALAHEQKFMGTVTSVEGVHVQLTTTDKKDVMVMLHDKTKILRGKETQKAEDIKVGDRIVVITTDGKDKSGEPMLMAKEIRLGTAGTPKK